VIIFQPIAFSPSFIFHHEHQLFENTDLSFPAPETALAADFKLPSPSLPISRSKHVVKPPAGSLILESDVDEIPAKHTIALLKACQSPLPLHLQLRNYVYSFEFPTDMRSWRAQVHEWRLDGTTPYQHGPASPYVLTDSGWHCR